MRADDRMRKRLLPMAAPCVPCLRDTFNSRMISLIDLPRTKCSRLIRPIVSTTSIPRHPLASPQRVSLHITAQRGSKLDADHPSTGVNLPRRNTIIDQRGRGSECSWRDPVRRRRNAVFAAPAQEFENEREPQRLAARFAKG